MQPRYGVKRKLREKMMIRKFAIAISLLTGCRAGAIDPVSIGITPFQPIQITVADIQLVPYCYRVCGFNLAFIYGQIPETAGLSITLGDSMVKNQYGLQIALVNETETYSAGIQLALINYAGINRGLQLGLTNYTENRPADRAVWLPNLQIGLTNFSGRVRKPVPPNSNRAFQIGFVNTATWGIQVGLINYNAESIFPWMLLFNYSRDKTTAY